MTNEEIIESMSLPEMQEAILIGREDERDKYFPALVGYNKALGIYKYDYDLLAECFGREFADSSGENWDDLTDDKQYEYQVEGEE